MQRGTFVTPVTRMGGIPHLISIAYTNVTLLRHDCAPLLKQTFIYSSHREKRRYAFRTSPIPTLS